MIQAVVDANVFVSSVINPHGTPGQILRAACERRFQLVLSDPILEEIDRVLHYPDTAKYHQMGKEEIRLFMAGLSHVALLTPGELALNVITADPSDNKYLACAVEGRAEYIVSGDEHLLALRRFHDVIPILTPQEFLSILSESEDTREHRL
jgi:putative PIN family toxin of toxin-antitoxin system